MAGRYLAAFIAGAAPACAAMGYESGSHIDATMCHFDFQRMEDCHLILNQQPTTIGLTTTAVSEHELQLTHVVLNSGQERITLSLSHSVSIMPGDRGYVLVEDINFDQRPDIGISTSFGVANAYLDYWVTSENAEQFHYVGNFPRLEVDSKTQTLSATVRVSAANYENKRWRWEDQELVQIAAP